MHANTARRSDAGSGKKNPQGSGAAGVAFARHLQPHWPAQLRQQTGEAGGHSHVPANLSVSHASMPRRQHIDTYVTTF